MYRCFLNLALLLAVVSVANATTIAFQLDIWSSGAAPGGFDTAFIKLTNKTTGAGNARISKFEFILGDTTNNFDLSTSQTSSGNLGTIARATSDGVMLDGAHDGVRANSFAWTFTTFDKNDSFTTWVELDKDMSPANNIVDFRSLLFGPGGAANATAKVTFVPFGADSIPSSTTLTFMLPDRTPNAATNYTYSFLTVPEPGTLTMFAAGIGTILLSRIRRRRR